MSAKEVLRNNNMELLKKLPMNDVIFLTELQNHDLLPGNNRSVVDKLLTDADKANHLLEFIGTDPELYLPYFFKAIEAYNKSANNLGLASTLSEMKSQHRGTYTFLAPHRIARYVHKSLHC